MNDDFKSIPVFDKEKALSRVHYKEDLLDRVLLIYQKSLVDRRAIMTQELFMQNWEALKNLAHSIKGSSLTIGAEQLGEVSYAMEKAAEEKDLDLFNKLFKIFQESIARYIEFDKYE